MKHLKEINEILNEALPKKEWMTEEDHQEAVKLTLEALGVTKEILSKQIDIGIENGYSLDTQRKLITKLISQSS